MIKDKKEELTEIKQESYYQQKKTAVQLEEEEKEQEEKEGKKKKDKKHKKKWVDLNTAEFEDQDGVVSGDDDDKSSSASEGPDVVEEEEKPEDKEDKEEDRKNSIGLVEIPDDPIDWEADDDIFNTGAAEAVLSGDIKLAIIPDDPVYDDEEDPFSTKIADEIAKFDREKKRKESSKLKFTGLSNVADVLSGKADKVDKNLIDVTVKSKRRRANRINLIAEEQSDVTKLEDIGTFGTETIVKKSPGEEQCDFLSTVDNNLAPIPVGDLLTATPSPIPISPGSTNNKSEGKSSSTLLDLHDFEELETKDPREQLTSNVAILAGEFTTAAEEEADDFDAAFDALAQESVVKYKLEELEKQWEDEDVFDTSNADKILNLVSLANKVEVEEEPIENWDDKDPFDTSAYDEITCDLEADLGFESLANRDPEEEKPIIGVSVAEIDPFLDLSKGSDAFGGIPGITVAKAPDVGWAAFKEEQKPKRPPPPKPAPPRPNRPSLDPSHSLDPSQKSSVACVVTAPSLESIKSWNCATADKLITKSKLEALDNSPVDEEEEFDPFDTSNYKDVGEVEEEELEDPFDTSAIPDFKESEESSENEEEEVPDVIDLLNDRGADKNLEVTLVPVAKDIDPFDTEFASDILPNKGDPFDTTFVKGGPGKAEIRALEEEFIDKEETDSQTEGNSIFKKQVAPAIAGRQRPSEELKGRSNLEILAFSEEKEDGNSNEEEDPFDTTIVNKVKEESEEEEIDPFDTTVAISVIPELRAKAEAEAIAKAEEEERRIKEENLQWAIAQEKAIAEAALKLTQVDEDKPLSTEPIAKPLPHSLTDDDFDPRG